MLSCFERFALPRLTSIPHFHRIWTSGPPLPKKPTQDGRLTSTACLRSLGFRDIDARLHDIAAAYRGTCDWLFSTTQFQRWRDRADLPDHNGVLWIKGKPGAGKSTLMKHALRHCEEVLHLTWLWLGAILSLTVGS
jgi:hypothetical protein